MKLPPTAALVMSVNAPPLMLGEETSSTAAIIEVARITFQIERMAEEQPHRSGRNKNARCIEDLVAGDSRVVDNGAIRRAERARLVEVTQSGAGPATFVAIQPAGSAGATTLSNLSKNSVQSGPPQPLLLWRSPMRRGHGWRRRECAAYY